MTQKHPSAPPEQPIEGRAAIDPVAFGFAQHDHNACIRTALSAATSQCKTRAVQLTPQRRRVLEILLETHEAMGAYDVLARLNAEGLGSKPPVAYRALSFLVEQGLAHRIERLNAFVACARPGLAHDPTFLICRLCHKVAEGAAPAGGVVRDAAAVTGFEVEQCVIEAEGVCAACQKQTPC